MLYGGLPLYKTLLGWCFNNCFLPLNKEHSQMRTLRQRDVKHKKPFNGRFGIPKGISELKPFFLERSIGKGTHYLGDI